MGNMNISTARTKVYAKEQRTMNDERYPKQTQSNPILHLTYPQNSRKNHYPCRTSSAIRPSREPSHPPDPPKNPKFLTHLTILWMQQNAQIFLCWNLSWMGIVLGRQKKDLHHRYRPRICTSILSGQYSCRSITVFCESEAGPSRQDRAGQLWRARAHTQS